MSACRIFPIDDDEFSAVKCPLGDYVCNGNAIIFSSVNVTLYEKARQVHRLHKEEECKRASRFLAMVEGSMFSVTAYAVTQSCELVTRKAGTP